ncbi:MAG TPA: regulatory protein RecX [Ferruginibacter sp.]|jgi:regulatory protein|nr:regulatory protein RecX [Ferruginibacter sp.]
MYKQQLTKEQALPKVRQYCAYQERCHSEVKEKLYGFGLYKKDVEQLISNLIEENYLNEERFAIVFAGGRFRIKHWGKMKIKYELKQKQVSEYCIKKALQEINSADYLKTLYKLAEGKLKLLKAEKNIFTKKKKLQDYLLQKGFEGQLIQTVIKDII